MKRILAISVALLVCLRAFAGVGVVGGVSIPPGSTDLRTADHFHAGLAVNLQLPIGFALQPQIIYSVRGATGQEIMSNVKLGYLEVPIQVQWGLNLARRNLRVYVFGEPFVGYNISSNAINMSTRVGELKDLLEYGVGLGAGIQLFERFQLSATQAWDLENPQLKPFTASSSRGIRLSVALLF